MLETLNLALQGVAIVLLFAGFTFGTATVVVGFLLSKRQESVIAGAKSEAAAANERSLKLELKVAEQQERAAKAEHALLELQERARPRTLSDDARAALIRFGARGHSIAIKFVSGSVVEPLSFARELADALKAAGWTITSTTGGPSLGRPPVGLVIQYVKDEPTPDSVRILKSALESAGLMPSLEPRPDMKPEKVVLMVGLKP